MKEAWPFRTTDDRPSGVDGLVPLGQFGTDPLLLSTTGDQNVRSDLRAQRQIALIHEWLIDPGSPRVWTGGLCERRWPALFAGVNLILFSRARTCRPATLALSSKSA
jgi:hypothetical protein